MHIKRILCPIDFSEYNIAANEYASMLARSTGARIIYLHTHVPDIYESPPAYFDAAKETRDLTRKMEEFVKPIGGGIASSYVIEFGLPTDRIVHYANNSEIDLIVMGTHGRRGFSRVLMGSVAEAVVRKANCPVLALKSDTKVPVDVLST